MPAEKKRLIVIDANSVIHRAYHALPPLTTKKGELVNAVYGFLLVFFKIIKEFQPDFIVAAFDAPGPTFRDKEFKEYKAKRPPAPDELYNQIPRVKQILEALNIPVFEKEGFEADDIIGTISHLAPKRQIMPPIESVILSGDQDILQLVDSWTKVYLLRKGVKDTVLYDENLVREKYQGLTPEQLVDFKALKGDPSDNIPGIPGVGEKTGLGLIKEFGSLENLYSTLNQRPPHQWISGGLISVNQRLRAKLEEHKELAFLSKKLVTIRKDAPIEFKIKDAQWQGYGKEKAIQIFRELGFSSLLERLPKG